MIETQRDRSQNQGHMRTPACTVLIWLHLRLKGVQKPIVLESDLTDGRINERGFRAVQCVLCWHRLENSLAAGTNPAGLGSCVFGATWLSKNPPAFLRSGSNGHIPRAFFCRNMPSESSASACTTDGQRPKAYQPNTYSTYSPRIWKPDL